MGLSRTWKNDELVLLFGQSDDEGAALGEIGFGDFGDEREIEVVDQAGRMGGVIEEINDVSAEAIFEASSFFEIERASGVDPNVARLFEERGEDALKEKRSAADLLHGKGDGVISHWNEYKARSCRDIKAAIALSGNCLQWMAPSRSMAHSKG